VRGPFVFLIIFLEKGSEGFRGGEGDLNSLKEQNRNGYEGLIKPRPKSIENQSRTQFSFMTVKNV